MSHPMRWSLLTRVLHWAVAVLVAVQLLTGRLSQAVTDPAASSDLIRTHYQFGMVLAVLVVARLTTRFLRPAPPALDGEPLWRRRAATGVHLGLYALLVILPVSGFVVWDYFDADMSVFGLVVAPDLVSPTENERLRALTWYAHAVAGWALLVLLLLHLCAAGWHHWLRRDRLLERIL